MGFKYVEYDTLSKYIRESIATEVKRHKLDEKNLPKALKSLSISHPERAIQCKYLLAVLSCLDNSNSPDKTCVLYAAAFYIRDQIFASYQGTVTSFFLSPENSTLYNALTTSLNLDKENFPDSKNLLEMYKALSSFMNTQVYIDADPSKGYLHPSKQTFSGKKIKDYKVEKVLQDLVKKIADLELNQIEKAKEQQLKDSDSKIKKRIGLFANGDVIPPAPALSKEFVEDPREHISVQCT
ncbi:Dot/Icm T4SS effector [Legionella steigerwaltii]|uniref:Dot/Icm T4SS effector n=1 Tax=Legionella steigerwaltii TaxID=460 RepID=A0A378LAY7_9GAMM|nr:hypothetical protein [Legionella steigerwaltii]KTD80842.1 Dot/Icm T4SS effector [Legionella steigerwaltii]STY23470.1 Dot/Icm T4SS effector [Legionella steigerwaltii]